MPKITFDKYGNSMPYGLVPLSIDECEELFVSAFLTSTTRAPNWNGYINFTTQLKTVAINTITQWLDGSFTTNKLNPGDIDVVNIINYLDFKPGLIEFDMNRSDGYPKKKYNIDGYIILNLPITHPFYKKCVSQKEYWKEFFSTDRNDNPKSILEVTV
jgi:hypothetical protein